MNNKEIIQLLKQHKKFQKLPIGFFEGKLYYGLQINNKNAIFSANKKFYIDNIRIDRKTKQKIGNKEIPFEYINAYKPLHFEQTEQFYDEYINKKNIYQYRMPRRRLFQKLWDTIDFYMDLQPEQTTIISLWIIATYFYVSFYWYPILFIHAPKGSGKTKLLDILYRTAFRTKFVSASGSVTRAQLIRSKDAYAGTTIIDEYESSVDAESKKAVNTVLNGSCKRDATTEILTKDGDGNWDVKEFDLFSPCVLASIQDIHHVTKSRCLTIRLFRTKKDKGSRKIDTEKQENEFAYLRKELAKSAFSIAHFIKAVKTHPCIKNFKNRDLDNFLPLISTVLWFVPERIKDVEKYYSDFYLPSIKTSDEYDAIFFHILKKRISNLKFTETGYTSIKQIVEVLSDVIYADYPDRWVGSRLKAYNFVSSRRNTGMFYKIERHLDDVLETYFSEFNLDADETFREVLVKEETVKV